MSGFDIFAWIVLIILVACAVGVFCIAGWLPGHIAKIPRPSVGAGGDGGRLGHADLRLCAVAGRADLGLCRCAGSRSDGATAMIDRDHGGLSGAAVRAGAFRHRPLQPVLEDLAVHRAAAAQFRLFIPMGWGAPQGPALVVRNAVAIVPDVAGEVTEVPVTANTPLKAGDVLFTIDPTPYRGAGQGASRRS